MMSLTLMWCLLLLVVVTYNATATKVYVPELSSRNFDYCHDKKKYSCPDSNSSQELRITACGFQCAPGTSYVCKDDKKGRGVLEFCAEPEVCAIGLMNKVYFDDDHQKVVIEKSVCPEAFYQPVRENCYTACSYFKHEDADLIERLGIKVLYPGNNTHPGRGYCDVERGFVSSNSNMYTSLAENEVSVCDKLVDFETLCPKDKRLLPNRQCGNICKKGYVVDKLNYFTCSMGTGDNSSTVIEETTAHLDQNVTPSPPEFSKHINITSPSTPSTSPHQKDSSTILVAVIVPSTVVVIVFVCCICWRCRSSRNRRGDYQPGSEKKKSNKKVMNIKKNCTRNEFNTENGDIKIYLYGNQDESITRKSSSADTGVSTSNVSEVELDQELDRGSIESGYRTVHSGEPLPQQFMKKLKSLVSTHYTDEDTEQTIPMQIVDSKL